MTTTNVSAAAEHEVDETVHNHPTDLQYVKIALFLGVLTALEVGTYFWEGASTTMLVAVLFPMMIIKFAVVTGYFMHLKYDNPIFKRVFVFGLVLATIVYMIALFAFEFWDDQYLKYLR
ncbi:MAG: cytochrome C oxidase subunit IV family protein [Microthrixaceae bacterium]